MAAKIIEIETLDHPGLDLFARLTETQLRNRLEPEKGIFIAESPKVIRVALEAGCEPLALLTERKFVETQAAEFIRAFEGVPIYTGATELLSQLTGYALTRGVLCAMRRPASRCVEEVCAGLRRVVVLDSVVDATNVGAIFRSAAALGFEAVLLTPTCCDPLNRRAVRVSMGTVFQIPWTYLCTRPEEWPMPAAQSLRSLGFKLAAMALADNAIALDDTCLAAEEKLAVIMGAEGDGLSRKAIAGSDYVVKITMAHGVDSLNVAAASAVAFWQLRVK